MLQTVVDSGTEVGLQENTLVDESNTQANDGPHPSGLPAKFVSALAKITLPVTAESDPYVSVSCNIWQIAHRQTTDSSHAAYRNCQQNCLNQTKSIVYHQPTFTLILCNYKAVTLWFCRMRLLPFHS